jgi:hypothetical protein
MKRTILVFFSVILFISHPIHADEGMWLPVLIKELNIVKMQEMGLTLTAEQIYSVNSSCLKDAIPIFGGGCTSEIISGQGLLMTNMHCGYRQVQSHSSLEHDYLKNGFWAKSREEELPNPGLSVTFLIRMEDVTEEVLKEVTEDMDEEERREKIREVSERIEDRATEGNHYETLVRSYYGGNQYYLIVYERYRDVRLVGAPPVSISDFGSLTDNWMWPRHKADFALFRVYMSPDGKPAEYSPDNVPLKPKHYLPVSIRGVEKGDFAMILGYPGSTTRYMTSYGIEELLEVTHPNRIKIRGKKLDLMNEDMNADPGIRIKYAAKYKGASNYWKYSIGQTEGLNRLKVLEKKKAIEEQFSEWVKSSPAREAEYGDALDLIKSSYAARREYAHASQYIRECLISGGEIISFANSIHYTVSPLRSPMRTDEEEMEIASAVKERAERFFKDYNAATDKKIIHALFRMFMEDVDPAYFPESFSIITGDYQGDVGAFVDDLFAQSIFTDQSRFNDFQNNLDPEIVDKDLAVKMASPIYLKSMEMTRENNSFSLDLTRGQRLFIAGLMEMEKGKVFYPDANSTMRLTYGTVGDYSPKDAVLYKHYTTLKGVMEKENPDNYEFIIPSRLKELYEKKDYGRYGDDGVMPVCFTTNNDITGGNSGSPVIGANGELIGLAFDGNWEAMSGDIAFEPDYQKTICVDTRYILFIIDKYAGASYLVDEMTLVE